MTTIWLTRHAESADPTVFHGAESDVELSDLGKRQAEAAAGWFRALSPTAVISSAMIRARETAIPIAMACRVPHTFEPELHERHLGPLSGSAVAPGADHWTETAARWVTGDTAFAPTGAESLNQIRERVLPVFQRIAQQHADGRVVVIAHGVVCKVLLLSLLPGFGPADWVRVGRVVNLAVSELVYDEHDWTAMRLLHVPEPVEALTVGATIGLKSEG